MSHAQQIGHALDRKRLATAKARACLRGVIVHELEGDDGRPLLVACQGAWTKIFTVLDELESWLDRTEGVRA